MSDENTKTRVLTFLSCGDVDRPKSFLTELSVHNASVSISGQGPYRLEQAVSLGLALRHELTGYIKDEENNRMLVCAAPSNDKNYEAFNRALKLSEPNSATLVARLFYDWLSEIKPPENPYSGISGAEATIGWHVTNGDLGVLTKHQNAVLQVEPKWLFRTT